MSASECYTHLESNTNCLPVLLEGKDGVIGLDPAYTTRGIVFLLFLHLLRWALDCPTHSPSLAH